MLYLAHFSFDEHGDEQNHGYFTCVVKADSVDDSLDKFHALISKLRRETEVFQDVIKIYLDDVIQIKQVPSEGFLAHWETRIGEPPPSISTSLPGVDEEYCQAFGPVPEIDDEEGFEVEPFMAFE